MKTQSLETLVGDTPMVELRNLPLPEGVRLYAKLEGANPTGSIKDRIALAMLRAAECEGRLRPGDAIVEASTGNTGIALAMLGRLAGYTVHVVVPENVFPEIGRLLGAYGAVVHWVSGGGDVRAAMLAARALADRYDWYLPDQFSNPRNVEAHYATTGAEILRDLPDVDVVVAGLGTGGTITGVGRRLKEARPAVKVVAVEPHPGSQVQGLQSFEDGYVPPILDAAVLDGKVLIRSRHAFAHALTLARSEGIFAGPSGGAVVHAALRFARRVRRGKIVCVLADGGWKYLGTRLWEATPEPPHPDEDELDDTIWW